MWRKQIEMKCDLAENVRIVIPKAALRVIFDECDGFDRDETGGRVIGTFSDHDSELVLRITGIIESGPQAKRSPVSFFQDGEYQEGVFRRIERRHPEIEHLGTWHTHHVNGLRTLSGGDIATYSRTVNHHNQNTPFFYALLVTTKNESNAPLERYSIKHFLFRRGDKQFYEIPPRLIEIVDTPLLWPAETKGAEQNAREDAPDLGAQPQRVQDRNILGDLFPGFHPFASPTLGLYWKGFLDLVDGSNIEVVVVEDSGSGKPSYTVALRKPTEALRDACDQLANQGFSSAVMALITAERLFNRVVYSQRGQS
jgi:hypothetical protein